MLRGLVKQNSAGMIKKSFAASMEALNSGDWLIAIRSLTEMRGVGPATASAILAPLPNGKMLCPFMADEVLECVNGKKREYSLRAYEDMQPRLVSKAKELNTRDSNKSDWTAEDVGKALWTAGILSVYGEVCASESVVVGDKKKRKKEKDNDILSEEISHIKKRKSSR